MVPGFAPTRFNESCLKEINKKNLLNYCGNEMIKYAVRMYICDKVIHWDSQKPPICYFDIMCVYANDSHIFTFIVGFAINLI